MSAPLMLTTTLPDDWKSGKFLALWAKRFLFDGRPH